MMPFGNIFSLAMEAAPSRHFSPLYPLYLAGWLIIFPYSPLLVHLASLCMSLFLLCIAYVVFRDLFDKERAIYGTAFLAGHGILIDLTGKCLSENLLLTVLVLIIWSFIKVIRTGAAKWILLAGIFSGLGFLCKAKAGNIWYALLLFALIGYQYIRRKWLVSFWPFFGSTLLFGLISGPWLGRNFIQFGTTSTSIHNNLAYQFAFNHIKLWFWGIIIAAPYFLFFLVLHLLLFLPFFRHGIKRNVELYLEVALMLFFFFSSWLISGAVWSYEGDMNGWNVARYFSLSLIPLLFLSLSERRCEEKSIHRVWLVSVSMVFLSGITMISASFVFEEKSLVSSKEIQTVEMLARYVEKGDTICIEPAIHKNLLLYYHLRFERMNSPHRATVINGCTDCSGKKCRFLVNYSSELRGMRGFRMLSHYKNKVSIWERE